MGRIYQENTIPKKIICCGCGRQMVSYSVSEGDRLLTTKTGAVRLVGDSIVCGSCAKDLDSNGLFPEEVGQLTKEEQDLMGYNN